MFNDIITYPIENEKLQWHAKEVVKNFEIIPHLFIRITLTGTLFPMTAQIPVVKIGTLRSHHVLVSDDRLTAYAYFNQEPPNGTIEFGFGDVMLLRFKQPYVPSKIPRLDRKLLPKNIQLLIETKR